MGVSAVVGVGQNRPGGGEETGGGVNDEIGDVFGGGVGRGTKGVAGGEEESQGASGSSGAEWSGAEDG